MHMWRFIAISSIEEKTKWPDPQYGWHLRQTYITFATQKYRKQPVEHTTIWPVLMTEKDAGVVVSAEFSPSRSCPQADRSLLKSQEQTPPMIYHYRNHSISLSWHIPPSGKIQAPQIRVSILSQQRLGVRPSAVYRAAQRGRSARVRWERVLTVGETEKNIRMSPLTSSLSDPTDSCCRRAKSSMAHQPRCRCR